MLYAQSRANLACLAVECDGGAAAGLAPHFDVPPAHAAAPARSQGLHGRFFGGKAGGESLNAVGLGVTIADLSLSVDAPEKALAVPGDGLGDSRDFRDVNSSADNHSGKNHFSAPREPPRNPEPRVPSG